MQLSKDARLVLRIYFEEGDNDTIPRDNLYLEGLRDKGRGEGKKEERTVKSLASSLDVEEILLV